MEVSHQVWEPTYRHIISPAQVQLMISQMHTAEAYALQMKEGDRFLMAMEGEKILGFISFHPSTNDPGVMRIPKLYVKVEAQGKGAGRALLDATSAIALTSGLQALELNVNRYNKALYFYRRYGFYIFRMEDLQYHGFPLNDYVLRKQL